MFAVHNECTAFDCVVCHAWSPATTKRENLRRGWRHHLSVNEEELRNDGSSGFLLTLEELLENVHPDQVPDVKFVDLPTDNVGLVAHCMGYNEPNLKHQLEARSLKPESALSLEDWLALTPYVMLDVEGGISYENRGQLNGSFHYDTTRFFLEIWHGYYGVENALLLRTNVVRIHSILESALPANERRALTFLHETIQAQPERIIVEHDGSLTVQGDSGLHWHIIPSGNRIPIVQSKELGRNVCIQPEGSVVVCPTGDYPAIYSVAMINDVATSWRVSTLSNGLVSELKKARSGV
jgi:hypothetical protein